jgi:hypothetical protein
MLRANANATSACGKQFARLSGIGGEQTDVVIRSTSLRRVHAQSTAGIKDPQTIRDFGRTLLRSPASFPTISPDR